MNKWLIVVIIILSLLTIGSGMATGYAIISGKNKILKMELANKEMKDNLARNITAKKMRDEILSGIKTEVTFGNLKKIKLQIERWEQLKEIEKTKGIGKEIKK